MGIPKNNQIVVGITLLPEERVKGMEKLELLKKKLKSSKLWQYIKGETIKRKTDACVNSSPDRIFLGKESVILVGEAAGFISPSTAEGISYALRSGKYAANSILDDNLLHSYKSVCMALVQEITAKSEKAKSLKNPKYRLKFLQNLDNVIEVERI